jgi:hypothetical protein
MPQIVAHLTSTVKSMLVARAMGLPTTTCAGPAPRPVAALSLRGCTMAVA